MLDAVDHPDAVVERLARGGVEGEPDALHRPDGDDAPLAPVHLVRVHERRLRDVVAPLVPGDQLPATTSGGRPGGRPRRARSCAGSARVGSTPGSAASRRPSRRRRCSTSTSIVTGVHTAPPPTIRESRRHDWRSGGIVQNGVGQAGRRSGVYAITKPRIPYSEPAAPMTTRPSAHTGALVSEYPLFGERARHVVRDRGGREHAAVARPERDELHVELREEEPPGTEGEAAVRDDAEVLEERAVPRLVLPEHAAGARRRARRRCRRSSSRRAGRRSRADRTAGHGARPGRSPGSRSRRRAGAGRRSAGSPRSGASA